MDCGRHDHAKMGLPARSAAGGSPLARAGPFAGTRELSGFELGFWCEPVGLPVRKVGTAHLLLLGTFRPFLVWTDWIGLARAQVVGAYIRLYEVLGRNWRTLQSAKHCELSGMCHGIRQRTL
jgi:hypothetical protein